VKALRGTLTAIVLCSIAATGCSHDKPAAKPAAKPVAQKKKPAPPKETPRDPDPEPTPVSPSISVSMDIAESCNIPTTQTINPRFEFNRDELLREDRKVLETIATCLNTGNLKGRNVQLVGRADPRGTEEYNMALGLKRANTVGSYLHKLGVGESQTSESTRGSIDATGTSENGWRNDRRVDIVLTTPSEKQSMN
jgi:peptidoglycan-associated lipoprotein